MGTDDEAEGDIYGKSKDKLSTRLQSGMNLQICFVNEPVDGSDLEEDSPRILAAEENLRKESHVTNRFGRVTGSSRLSGPGIRLSRESSSTSSTSPKVQISCPLNGKCPLCPPLPVTTSVCLNPTSHPLYSPVY